MCLHLQPTRSQRKTDASHVPRSNKQGQTGPQKAMICGEPSGLLASCVDGVSMETDHQEDSTKDGYTLAPYHLKPLAAILEIIICSNEPTCVYPGGMCPPRAGHQLTTQQRLSLERWRDDVDIGIPGVKWLVAECNIILVSGQGWLNFEKFPSTLQKTFLITVAAGYCCHAHLQVRPLGGCGSTIAGEPRFRGSPLRRPKAQSTHGLLDLPVSVRFSPPAADLYSEQSRGWH